MVPPLPRYCKALRLPAAPPALLRFLRFAVPPLASYFAPAGTRRSARGPGVIHRIPQSRFIDGNDRTSQVPGGPRYERAVLSDPGGTSALGHCRASVLSSAKWTTSTPNDYQKFRGSIARPAHSLSTLRRVGYPTTTQDSLSGGWPALPGGTGYPPGPNERFQVIPSSFPRLRLAHPDNSESDKRRARRFRGNTADWTGVDRRSLRRSIS